MLLGCLACYRKVVLRALPTRLVLTASLFWGLLLGGSALGDPLHRAPWTAFTEGHLVAMGIAAKQLPFWLSTDRMGWPDSLSFRPLLWPTLPVAALLGPVLTFNLIFWLTPLLNALGGLALARQLRLEPWPAATLAGLLAWNHWTFNTLANGQIEQSYPGGVAILWASAIWAASLGGPRLLFPGLLCLLFGLAAPHVALVGLLGLPLVGLFRREGGTLGWLGRWSIIGVGIGLSALLIHRYHAPAAGGVASLFAPKGVAQGAIAAWQFEAASWKDLLGRAMIPSGTGPQVVHSAALGMLPIALAILSLWKNGARRWMILVLFFSACALGSQMDLGAFSIPTPTGLLSKLSPELGRSAHAYRMALGAVVGLSILLAPLGRNSFYSIGILALCWAEVGLLRTRPLPLPALELRAEPYAERLSGGSGPLLDLPLVGSACAPGPYHYALQGLVHDRPLLHSLRLGPEAYGRTSPHLGALQRAFASPTCPAELSRFLRGLGVHSLVVHADGRCPVETSTLSCLEEAFGEGEELGAHRWWVW